ncbi:hypothetical protein GGTG_12974 [Gaeumannomyces tritici R3-111a-1]|uniref:Uncharacterized protein n=1 Tax=Gaeumannomyces tritici (strain R3-111a-1) TaxID=644352 RepID=J3PHJ4_GAET3|nr:hypothetical protein GGTG_12974 [Gaeumannomyces tritici R3-111a-1]EJT69355.1 hypothetical protein GGTG_12974 [Gaeumannomyces tritici R3-111a-1]
MRDIQHITSFTPTTISSSGINHIYSIASIFIIVSLCHYPSNFSQLSYTCSKFPLRRPHPPSYLPLPLTPRRFILQQSRTATLHLPIMNLSLLVNILLLQPLLVAGLPVPKPPPAGGQENLPIHQGNPNAGPSTTTQPPGPGGGAGGQAPSLGVDYDLAQLMGHWGTPPKGVYLQGSYSAIIQVSKDITRENMVELAYRAYGEMSTIFANRENMVGSRLKPEYPSRTLVALEVGDRKIVFASSTQFRAPSGLSTKESSEFYTWAAGQIASLGSQIPNSVGAWTAHRWKNDAKSRHRLDGKCAEFNALRLDAERQNADRRWEGHGPRYESPKKIQLDKGERRPFLVAIFGKNIVKPCSAAGQLYGCEELFKDGTPFSELEAIQPGTRAVWSADIKITQLKNPRHETVPVSQDPGPASPGSSGSAPGSPELIPGTQYQAPASQSSSSPSQSLPPSSQEPPTSYQRPPPASQGSSSPSQGSPQPATAVPPVDGAVEVAASPERGPANQGSSSPPAVPATPVRATQYAIRPASAGAGGGGGGGGNILVPATPEMIPETPPPARGSSGGASQGEAVPATQFPMAPPPQGQTQPATGGTGGGGSGSMAPPNTPSPKAGEKRPQQPSSSPLETPSRKHVDKKNKEE